MRLLTSITARRLPCSNWYSSVLTLSTILSCLFPCFDCAPKNSDVVAEFLNPNVAQDGMGFEKLVVDPSTGRLYLGAVNNLYELYQDSLLVKTRVSTGPEDDSIECPSRQDCTFKRTQTNAYTKALAVFDKNSKLIECTSLFQGRCRLRNLYNIAQSDGVKESQPIVANDRDSSTVVFVAPGPQDVPSDGTESPALYVASTFTNQGSTSYRDDVPAVAALSLNSNDLFEVAVTSVTAGTELKLLQTYRGVYNIDYVNGFHSGQFAYFVTRQPKGENNKHHDGQWPIISKLVRLCTADKNFYSYTEVPLTCTDRDGTDYNLVKDVYLGKPGYDLAESMQVSTEDDVLYAVFARGAGGTELSTPTRESALCVYSIKQVERIFLENIEMCYRGEANMNLPWFKGAQCQQTQISGADALCGKDVNSFIGGGVPITAYPALTTNNAEFTAVVANTTHAATVAFIGARDGRLFKTVIESKDSAFVYRTLEVGNGKPILQDMELDGNGEFLYIATADKLSKIRVRQCGDTAVCTQCLAQRDPYCGWCVSANRCSVERDCARPVITGSDGGPSFEPAHWLSYKTGQCTTIRSVDPSQLQITQASFLTLKLDNLPSVAGDLYCEFRFPNGQNSTMAGETPKGQEKDTLRCPTPSSDRLPSIPDKENSLVAKLSVTHNHGPPLASTNFTFYDCGKHTGCTKCVSSAFPCDWCIQSNQCVSGILTENRCRGQSIVNGVNRTGFSSRKGASFCPHIVSDTDAVYVASGGSRNVTVRAKNIMDFMTDFKCLFRIDHSIHEKPAKRVGDQITCEEMRFEYFGPGRGNGTAVADFDVVWSKGSQFTSGHLLDNNIGIHVVMYKCESLATNCGICLTLNEQNFDCGWCHAEKTCTGQAKCTAPTLFSEKVAGGNTPAALSSGWLTRDELCPSPQILDFYPKKGPISGGTRVTIQGVNLGRDYNDVANAVSTANVRCEVVQDLYVTASRIVCTTKASLHLKPASNPIIIKLLDNLTYTAISNDNYEYVEPTITGFSPNRGPASGGTDVSIRGQNLDAGSSVSAFIAGEKCEIKSRSNEEILCRTTASKQADVVGHLKVTFDGSEKDFVNFQYRYEKDPKVTSVRPEKSIASGGIQVNVRGSGFSLIQRPRMVVMESDKAWHGPLCRVANDEMMFCTTPNLRIPADRLMQPTKDHPLMLDYGLEIDGNRAGNLSQLAGFERLAVYPDPTFDNFTDNGVKYHRQDNSLTITGRDIDLAASENDVSVSVGAEACNLTSLADRAITCQPPGQKPDTHFPNSPHPEVLIKIGGKSYRVGYLSYDSTAGPLSFEIIVAIAAAVLVFIIAFVLLLFAYRRKSTRHTRQMKNLKMQMDTIEMKVASECKEAFAELQTSMNAMTAEMPMGTPLIPFLSYRDYTTQVLFPNQVNHPVLRDLEVDSVRAQQIEKGLRQFNQLLMNKTFLLTFVRTMESNKYFLSKDRVYVGSLLMVVLQEKMEYCTDILKTLLEDLIERTIEKRLQPKILFRRSESIAERMLAAWFTFLMHRYLLECAGQPLFLLYWAIKQQMEKGPQDAISLEARYSLSEEKLLRSSFEFREVTVFVAADLVGQPTAEYPVRLLDCDTVTQVKEKCLDAIFRTTPCSNRPSANDLDLELRSGATGRQLLQDLDMTTKAELGGWKKLNTLAHYKVPNNSSLALLPRQASLYNLSLLSERSEKSSTFSLKNSPTLTRTFGANHHGTHGHSKDPESGFKLYHLVKPTENGPEGHHQEKMVSEIYLTRLLTMKGTLQKFIEDLLESIFSTAYRGSTLPSCIKYMFDFMDEQAMLHGITDPEVVHAWKSNALPLRFWVNLIKNPHFVFDVQKPTKIEGCLSVVAQTLMDACSTQDHQLTKDSPSSKLLFAKDIHQYREWVDRYYQEIKTMPAVSDQDMNALLADESRTHARQFHVFSALNELYKYLDQYKDQVAQELEQDSFAQTFRLPAKFHQMLSEMDGSDQPPVVYSRYEDRV